ncbi:MAG: 3-phosphoshikimate 1-carboxyvinyltransferase [Pseudomonadota bacterium]
MSGGTLDWVGGPAAGPLRGRIRVPGDKSISHRAMMLGSLADGVTEVSGFLEGEDTLATAAAFRAMGVRIEVAGAGRRIVHGVGLQGLRAPAGPLDLGNSGTGMRLMAGLLSGQAFASELVGDESLSRRPMKRVIEPLRRMGAAIESREGVLAPLRISPATDGLSGIGYVSPVASAQVKSCLLLAGLYARGITAVTESHRTRDHTERMLRAFGVDVRVDGNMASVAGGQRLHATAIEVPADVSSAAFFLVAASLVPGSDLVLESVGINPLRDGIVRALRLMGAQIAVGNPRLLGDEPVADLRVQHAPLRGIEVPEDLVPDMIDEFPVLFAAAAVAQGTTVVRGAAELRVKESDRIAAMAAALRALGARVEETADGAVIHGGPLHGGRVDSRGDHRIAMATGVAAQVASGTVTIGDCANVATSFPGFVELACGAGFSLSAVA